MTDIQEAMCEFTKRSHRINHPSGSFDKQGRWYPSDNEKRSCCNAIRSPSTSFPYSLMNHCRTKKHIAELYKVDIKELGKAIKNSQVPLFNGQFRGLFPIVHSGVFVDDVEVYVAETIDKAIIFYYLNKSRSPSSSLRRNFGIPLKLEELNKDPQYITFDNEILKQWKVEWLTGLLYTSIPHHEERRLVEVWYRYIEKEDLLETLLNLN